MTLQIETYYRQGFSLAAITSCLYLFHGVSGIRYMELKKKVFTELQRIDSDDKKKKTLTHELPPQHKHN